MPEVTGQVEKIEGKQAKNGGEYTAITLKGQKNSFYDWGRHCAEAGITAGDTIKIEHDGKEFARVTGLKKLESGEAIETKRRGSQRDKDSQIARMCALKCAASILQGSNLTYEEQVGKIFGLAVKLEDWIKE